MILFYYINLIKYKKLWLSKIVGMSYNLERREHVNLAENISFLNFGGSRTILFFWYWSPSSMEICDFCWRAHILLTRLTNFAGRVPRFIFSAMTSREACEIQVLFGRASSMKPKSVKPKKKTIFIWLLVQFIIGSQNGFTYSYFASSSSLVNHQPLTGGMCCALWKYSNLSLCLNYNLIFIRTSLLLGTAP